MTGMTVITAKAALYFARAMPRSTALLAVTVLESGLICRVCMDSDIVLRGRGSGFVRRGSMESDLRKLSQQFL